MAKARPESARTAAGPQSRTATRAARRGCEGYGGRARTRRLGDAWPRTLLRNAAAAGGGGARSPLRRPLLRLKSASLKPFSIAPERQRETAQTLSALAAQASLMPRLPAGACAGGSARMARSSDPRRRRPPGAKRPRQGSREPGPCRRRRPDVCWIVGDAGLVLRYHAGVWQRLEPPADAPLVAVTALDALRASHHPSRRPAPVDGGWGRELEVGRGTRGLRETPNLQETRGSSFRAQKEDPWSVTFLARRWPPPSRSFPSPSAAACPGAAPANSTSAHSTVHSVARIDRFGSNRARPHDLQLRNRTRS